MADQDKSKGFSLRKKDAHLRNDPRGLGSGRPDRNQRAAQGAREANSTNPRLRPRTKTNDTTSNLVKKRYSIRYNQAPDLSQGALPPLPSLPKIPLQHAAENRARDGGGRPQNDQEGVDMGALRDPDLEADQYVANFLANATEKDLSNYQRDLKKVRSRASTDLQHNVFQNRTQFIKISKEAEKLKTEMQTLQGLMNDLSSTLEQAGWSSKASVDDGAKKKNNRTSVANLEAMWNTQLQTLWKMIEGSQKFVAAIPGRHVVMETEGWVELDAATWKTRRPAHLVLLNDHLLVATRKRKRPDPKLPPEAQQKAPTKLVAERCWPLQDIDLVDLTADAMEIRGPFRNFTQITGAITIKHGRESFTYRSERPESRHKNDFVIAFKRAVEELRRAERAAAQENSEAANTASKEQETINYLATRDPAVSHSPGLLGSLGQSGPGMSDASSATNPDLLIDVDGKQRNMRWVEAQIDELDIAIALQRFESAVSLIEQLRRLAKTLGKSNSVAQDLIAAKVDARAARLADVLTQLLIERHAHLTPTLLYTGFLNRMDFASRAQLAYLAARSKSITMRSRQCVFEGDVLAHVTALSVVYFTLVRNTVNVFSQCFPQSSMGAVIVWAKQQLDAYNEALDRALSGLESGGQLWKDALTRARELASLMDEAGLDFKDMVGVDLDSV